MKNEDIERLKLISAVNQLFMLGIIETLDEAIIIVAEKYKNSSAFKRDILKTEQLRDWYETYMTYIRGLKPEEKIKFIQRVGKLIDGPNTRYPTKGVQSGNKGER